MSAIIYLLLLSKRSHMRVLFSVTLPQYFPYFQLGMLLSIFFYFFFFWFLVVLCCVYFWHKFSFRFLWRVFMTATRKTVEHNRLKNQKKKKYKENVEKNLDQKQTKKIRKRRKFRSCTQLETTFSFPTISLVFVWDFGPCS